ncbi:MAG: bifunctional glutamate N-acetyltransferase/amino-acid acetyltransferase ArgJ [bacterium]|nr:bifunctional glutamate N-acetyltransferase/amino-acid acetyltransferase ArgJ [bacterium]
MMKHNYEIIEGGITAPVGFKAAGVHCGIKRRRNDIALICSDKIAACAGLFTTNQVKGEPLILSMPRIRSGRLQAIVANSGNANVCTGAQGLKDAEEMGNLVAEGLELAPELVAVASTGIIGMPLPMDKVRTGIKKALPALSRNGGDAAAEAIMTTDTRIKKIAVNVSIGNRSFRIGGIAKGSGMIHPNMATMFAFITTDAGLEDGLLQETLTAAVNLSFNMITVDGDTSTSDTVICMANGSSGVKVIPGSEEYEAFKAALNRVCTYLATEIARDGEGATHLLQVQVDGAVVYDDARKIAFAVASSNLVKTAIFGRDPNWGRIICAVGYAGPAVEPERICIDIGGIKLAEGGAYIDYDEKTVAGILSQEEIKLNIDLGMGKASATVWTCDLTYDYVKINARYHT